MIGSVFITNLDCPVWFLVGSEALAVATIKWDNYFYNRQCTLSSLKWPSSSTCLFHGVWIKLNRNTCQQNKLRTPKHNPRKNNDQAVENIINISHFCLFERQQNVHPLKAWHETEPSLTSFVVFAYPPLTFAWFFARRHICYQIYPLIAVNRMLLSNKLYCTSLLTWMKRSNKSYFTLSKSSAGHFGYDLHQLTFSYVSKKYSLKAIVGHIFRLRSRKNYGLRYRAITSSSTGLLRQLRAVGKRSDNRVSNYNKVKIRQIHNIVNDMVL